MSDKIIYEYKLGSWHYELKIDHLGYLELWSSWEGKGSPIIDRGSDGALKQLAILAAENAMLKRKHDGRIS